MSKRYVKPGQKPVEPHTKPGKELKIVSRQVEPHNKPGKELKIELRQVEPHTKPGQELKTELIQEERSAKAKQEEDMSTREGWRQEQEEGGYAQQSRPLRLPQQ